MLMAWTTEGHEVVPMECEVRSLADSLDVMDFLGWSGDSHGLAAVAERVLGEEESAESLPLRG